MKIVLNVLICIAILAVGVVGLKVLGKKPEVPTKDTAAVEQAVPVVTAEVKAWDLPFNVDLDGEAVTYRVITVGAEVQGRIVAKTEAARGGTYVKKGELLFNIDPTDYELEIERLNAQLQQTEEELNATAVDVKNTAELVKLAEEDLQLQDNQLARMKSLKQRGTANETEVETAMKQELLARNALLGLRNQQRTLTQQLKTKAANKSLVVAQLDKAKVDLKRCQVFSPLEGRIVADEVEQGDYIKPGEVLIHISDGSRMEVKTQLRAEELAWVWQQQVAGQKVSAGIDDPLNIPKVPCEVGYMFEGVETIWDGYLARLEGTGIDRDTRMFPCRVLVEKPRETRFNDSVAGATISPPTLLSGMFVTVRIPVESPLPLLHLPLEAVRPGGQIWVMRDGKLKTLEVSLAHVEDEMALIRKDGSGLIEGDRVIVSPLASVRDGMSVKELSNGNTDAGALPEAKDGSLENQPATNAVEVSE